MAGKIQQSDQLIRYYFSDSYLTLRLGDSPQQCGDIAEENGCRAHFVLNLSGHMLLAGRTLHHSWRKGQVVHLHHLCSRKSLLNLCYFHFASMWSKRWHCSTWLRCSGTQLFSRWALDWKVQHYYCIMFSFDDNTSCWVGGFYKIKYRQIFIVIKTLTNLPSLIIQHIN